MPRHQLQTGMGTVAAALFSGAVAPGLAAAPGAVAVGSDVLFFSGGGRLAAVIPHQAVFTLSGVGVSFYDSSVPVSGGPIPASGHIPLGGITAGAGQSLSGAVTPANTPIPIGTPFQSGLCYNSRSGQTGITVVWTPNVAAQ